LFFEGVFDIDDFVLLGLFEGVRDTVDFVLLRLFEGVGVDFDLSDGGVLLFNKRFYVLKNGTILRWRRCFAIYPNIRSEIIISLNKMFAIYKYQKKRIR